MNSGISPILALGAICAAVTASPAHAADKARISNLADVTFGSITGTADQSQSQPICVYSSSITGSYSVTATGSGGGGSFALSSGAAQLQYDVLWSESANQMGGSSLVANTPTTGLTSAATQQTCNSGPSSSASLTVVIRSATLSAAKAGDYSGTLQITIAPQ